jgi:hypothetical protein
LNRYSIFKLTSLKYSIVSDHFALNYKQLKKEKNVRSPLFKSPVFQIVIAETRYLPQFYLNYFLTVFLDRFHHSRVMNMSGAPPPPGSPYSIGPDGQPVYSAQPMMPYAAPMDPYYGQPVVYGGAPSPGFQVIQVQPAPLSKPAKSKRPWEKSEFRVVMDGMGVPRWYLAHQLWNPGCCGSSALKMRIGMCQSDENLDSGQKQLICRYLDQLGSCCRTDEWIMWVIIGAFFTGLVFAVVGCICGCVYCSWEGETERMEAAYEAQARTKWKD